MLRTKAKSSSVYSHGSMPRSNEAAYLLLCDQVLLRVTHEDNTTLTFEFDDYRRGLHNVAMLLGHSASVDPHHYAQAIERIQGIVRGFHAAS